MNEEAIFKLEPHSVAGEYWLTIHPNNDEPNVYWLTSDDLTSLRNAINALIS